MPVFHTIPFRDVPNGISGCEGARARARALPNVSICCASHRFAIYSLFQLCPSELQLLSWMAQAISNYKTNTVHT